MLLNPDVKGLIILEATFNAPDAPFPVLPPCFTELFKVFDVSNAFDVCSNFFCSFCNFCDQPP
jgi:hypothetical protein